jgi:hypothetical protein
MRRRIHVMRKMIHALGGGYMSYEEEDTCHMRKMIHVVPCNGDATPKDMHARCFLI